MSSRKKWVSAVSKGDQQVTHVSGDETQGLAAEDIVLLLSGFNNFGDKIYNYVKLPLNKVEDIVKAVNGGGRFEVRDFGEVIAAGLGVPTAEVKQEIESMYRMISFPPSSAS